MIGKIKNNNGTKEIEWIAGRAEGQGVPIGCIMAIYGNTAPNSSWLICDGSTFDAETYPALALYLGGNRLPDLRECVLVGAGQSSNDYDASTNPNGIHAHDVYEVGEFKDDQIQDHEHKYYEGNGNTGSFPYGSISTILQSGEGKVNPSTARTGTTTHGKQVGVNYIIKATSVSAETDHAAILAQIQRWNSYSTEETPTGKTWIDGKPIYRKCFYSATNWALDTNVGTINNVDMPICIRNISANNSTSGTMTYIENYGDYYGGGGDVVTSGATFKINTSTRVGTVVAARRAQFANNYPSCIIVEYTKTTD